MSNIPYSHNELTELIEKIRDITATDEYAMEFSPGVTNDEISQFEQENNLTFPDQVKEWLIFADGCCLFNTTVQLYGIAHKPYMEMISKGISEDYIQIGVFSFGEPICISRNSQKIVQYGETLIEYADFKAFLETVVDIGVSD